MFAKCAVAGLAFAALASAAMGQATTYAPGQLPAFSAITGTQQTVTIGDTFSTAFESSLLAPTANQVTAGYNYNFVDLYGFTTPTASAAADTITLTFSGQVVNPSNVQIGIFAAGTGGTVSLSQWADATGLTSATYTPSTQGYSFANLVGSTSGAVAGAGWSADSTSTVSVGGVTDTVVTLSNVSLGAGNYFLEVRGLGTNVNAGGYSGVLAILAVPEPATALLVLLALPLLGFMVRRARRSATAA